MLHRHYSGCASVSLFGLALGANSIHPLCTNSGWQQWCTRFLFYSFFIYFCLFDFLCFFFIPNCAQYQFVVHMHTNTHTHIWFGWLGARSPNAIADAFYPRCRCIYHPHIYVYHRYIWQNIQIHLRASAHIQLFSLWKIGFSLRLLAFGFHCFCSK